MKTVTINGIEVVVIDKFLFDQLVSENAARHREGKRKGLCTLQEACEMLGCHPNTLYQKMKDPNCKIRKSKINGNYIRESIERELERKY